MDKSFIDGASVALTLLESIRESNPELIADNLPKGWGMTKLRQVLNPTGANAQTDIENPQAVPIQLPVELEWGTVAEAPEVGVGIKGYFVTNPLYDVGLIDKVDPMECWGLTNAQAKFIVDLNDELPEAVEDAINAACYRLQRVAGISDGGYAGMHFSGSELRNQLMEMFAAYIVADVNSSRTGLLNASYQLTREQIDAAINGLDLRSYDDWMLAAKALLADAPPWTAIEQVDGIYLVKVSVDGVSTISWCPKYDQPKPYVYTVDDLCAHDRSAWAGDSWDGASAQDNEASIRNPVFVSLHHACKDR